MNRRRWLRTAGGLVATAALPGCATAVGGAVGRATNRYGRPVVPVQVAEDQVIREVVGLRPYRASGFVVRAERMGDKLVVHNYGHGGGGVTLSWGTSHMAADEVTSHTDDGPVAVLGAGAVGLAAARLLQRRGRPVTIYARELPPETTSNIAGAQWSPTSVSDDLTGPFRIQFRQATRLAYRHFQTLVGGGYGVRWVDNYYLSDDPPGPIPPWMEETRELYPELEDLEGDEHPFPTRYARRVATMFIEPPRYLAALLRDFRTAGGSVQVGELRNRSQIMSLPESTVVNCTGLGSRELFGDEELVPVKGQLAVMRPQPGVDYLTIGAGRFGSGGGSYMFPRGDGILLGGTFEHGVATLTPDVRASRRILDTHTRLFRAMAALPQHAEGSRP